MTPRPPLLLRGGRPGALAPRLPAGVFLCLLLAALVTAGCGPPPPTLDPTAASASQATRAPTATTLPEGSFGVSVPAGDAAGCLATQGEDPGPHYQAGAPSRERLGDGYVLEGWVLQAGSCRALPNATVEIWLAGPDGEYGDAWRGTVQTGDGGAFEVHTSAPVASNGMSPHMYLRVAAKDHVPVAVRHFPASGAITGTIAVVLDRQ